MADVTVESAVLKDGTLTITGSGFTRTTTYVEFDGNAAAFTLDDQGRIIVSEVPEGATEVDITKGEVTQTVPIEQASPSDQGPSTSDQAGSGAPSGGAEPYKTATPNQTPGDLTKDDAQTTSDVAQRDLAGAANVGAAEQQADFVNREPLKEGEHLTDDFRSRVENTAAEDITKTIGPRDPYPEGNPQDPNWGYRQAHGHEPKRPEDNADPRPIGLDGIEQERGDR